MSHFKAGGLAAEQSRTRCQLKTCEMGSWLRALFLSARPNCNVATITWSLKGAKPQHLVTVALTETPSWFIHRWLYKHTYVQKHLGATQHRLDLSPQTLCPIEFVGPAAPHNKGFYSGTLGRERGRRQRTAAERRQWMWHGGRKRHWG